MVCLYASSIDTVSREEVNGLSRSYCGQPVYAPTLQSISQGTLQMEREVLDGHGEDESNNGSLHKQDNIQVFDMVQMRFVIQEHSNP